MNSEKLYIEKELSWLSFNERVLQEAADKTVPLIERVRFLGIFSNNLDEFYKVRFADVKRRILIDREHGGNSSVKHLLSRIQSKTLKLNEEFGYLYDELITELARKHIYLISESQIPKASEAWVKNYFQESILPHITPWLITDDVELLTHIKDEYPYIFVEMRTAEKNHYALIEIPIDHLPKFIMIPERRGKKPKTIILLDNIIRFCLDDIFHGFFDYDELHGYALKMTRDAEYDLSHEVEYSLLEQMSEGLGQRLTAMPVRLMFEKNMPESMLTFLCEKLNISNYDSLVPGGRYHNFRDFISFPNVGRKYLENPPMPSMKCADFEGYATKFDAIKAKDILLYYPYHTFDHISELVRQSSFDPKVLSIKINIYRVAKESRLMNSLIHAVNNGKKVTVIIELQARFDEEANIEWSKLLTDSGVHVVFGTPGLKIHSKLLLITRKEGDELVKYAHIGTGNFNENTARVYTDFALLTADPELTSEVRNVFGYIEHPYIPRTFKHLIVSPQNSRKKLYKIIDDEIAFAAIGKKAQLTIKVNNLVDKGIINKLYEASAAGVHIRMIVRGMCSLIPGLPGISDNIRIISIVDRFLEHPRVFIAHNGGDPKVFISSADWMTRNIDYRIEVGTPIFDPRLKQRIIDILEIHFTDTVKARIIDKEMRNSYVIRGNRKKIRSQVAIYDYIKNTERQTRKNNEHIL